jgi:hypothetical protein
MKKPLILFVFLFFACSCTEQASQGDQEFERLAAIAENRC